MKVRIEQILTFFVYPNVSDKITNSIVLGGGCFWCLEAVFETLKGVSAVTSGYTGGTIKNPTYREVCSGLTGHNEVVRIEFDPDTIPLSSILDLFFVFHDPTTLNRQGNDVGTQYRSGIYFANASQEEESKAAFERAKTLWRNPIVTEILPLEIFYPAEDYHQSYYVNNSEQGYCRIVINPKVTKLRQQYAHLLK